MNRPLPLPSRPRPDVDPRIALVPLTKLFAWLADKSEADIRANLPKPVRKPAGSLAQGMAASVGEVVAPPPPQTPIRREIVRPQRDAELSAEAVPPAPPPPGSPVAISRAGPPGEPPLRALATIPGAPPRETKTAEDVAERQRAAPPPDTAPVLRSFPLGNTQISPKGTAPEPQAAPEPDPAPQIDAAPEIPQGMLALPPGAADPPLALPPPLSAPRRAPPPRMTRADDFLPGRPGQLFPDGI